MPSTVTDGRERELVLVNTATNQYSIPPSTLSLTLLIVGRKRESHVKDNLIQLADMIVGAITYSYTGHKDKDYWIKMLGKRIANILELSRPHSLCLALLDTPPSGNNSDYAGCCTSHYRFVKYN